MSGVLLGIQVLLAAVMLLSGLAKTFLSRAQLLQSGQSGMTDLALPTIRFIGVSELAGALGVTLPWWTGVWPWLTPLAALAFAVVMLLAFRVHEGLRRRAPTDAVARREARNRVTNVVLCALSLLLAVGRSLELTAGRAG